MPECVARRQDAHGSLRGQRSIGKSSRSWFPGIHWIASYCAVRVRVCVCSVDRRLACLTCFPSLPFPSLPTHPSLCSCLEFDGLSEGVLRCFALSASANQAGTSMVNSTLGFAARCVARPRRLAQTYSLHPKSTQSSPAISAAASYF